MSERGLFIVIEGVDGSGKTTQSELLSAYLRGLGRKVHHTAEPTATGLGGMVRDGLGAEHPRTSDELAAMFLADRVAHNVSPKSGIRQYVEGGTDVVCDRYYYSSIAYQGVGGSLEWVADMNLNCIRAGRSHFEIYEENAAVISETRRRYGIVFDMLAGRDNIVIVDGARSREEVFADIRAAVEKLL